jgi:NADH dehydrogenase (ubiquinone) 1 beta subcomplex subunit 8
LTIPSRYDNCYAATPRQLCRASQLADVNGHIQNGGYQNPPAVKRQHRDPYGGWWDKQEKRNFGEPVHEDNEILSVFSPEQYTHVSPGKGFRHLGVFVAAFLSLCGVVSLYYPDKPSAPKVYVDGLEKELGGPNAVLVRTIQHSPAHGAKPRTLCGYQANSRSSRLARLARTSGESNPLVFFFPFFCCVCKYQSNFVSYIWRPLRV